MTNQAKPKADQWAVSGWQSNPPKEWTGIELPRYSNCEHCFCKRKIIYDNLNQPIPHVECCMCGTRRKSL